MIRHVRHATFASALAVATPLASFASDDDLPLTWEVAAVSDYLFRGVSQTSGDPALQAGLRYSSGAGVYVGVWTSGIDFGSGKPRYELDMFIGYTLDIGEAISTELQANRYTYPDADGGNYNELTATITFLDTYDLALAYTYDVWGSGTDSWYYAAHVRWPRSESVWVDAHVGRTDFRRNAVVGASDYTDWGIGVSRRWGLLTASLGYYSTNGSGRDSFGKDANSRVMLSLIFGN